MQSVSLQCNPCFGEDECSVQRHPLSEDSTTVPMTLQKRRRSWWWKSCWGVWGWKGEYYDDATWFNRVSGQTKKRWQSLTFHISPNLQSHVIYTNLAHLTNETWKWYWKALVLSLRRLFVFCLLCCHRSVKLKGKECERQRIISGMRMNHQFSVSNFSILD